MFEKTKINEKEAEVGPFFLLKKILPLTHFICSFNSMSISLSSVHTTASYAVQNGHLRTEKNNFYYPNSQV